MNVAASYGSPSLHLRLHQRTRQYDALRPLCVCYSVYPLLLSMDHPCVSPVTGVATEESFTGMPYVNGIESLSNCQLGS